MCEGTLAVTKISKIITKAIALQLMSKDYILVREENCRKKKPEKQVKSFQIFYASIAILRLLFVTNV
jgi:hypothetical protein